MNPRLLLTAEAEADIDEAAQWYERRLEGLGVEFVGRVREALRRVTETPLLYPDVHKGLRRAPVRRFPYGIFYRQRADLVVVVAVFHERRSPTAWQQRG